ncbi:TRAP transporter substrate-binding protein [Acidovorax sacchari]|uniref:TRAP transporter substrate-binding protein n=1 Tax=Acidovorax sacchari TaxID=3230736 RepID=UPI0039E602F6
MVKNRCYWEDIYLAANLRAPRTGGFVRCHLIRALPAAASARRAALSCALALAALPGGAAPAEPALPASPPASSASAPGAAAPYRLRIVGNLGALSQYSRREAPFWTRDLPRLSGGRFTASIVPFDRAGVPGIEMLRLIELGVVPLGTVLMSSLTAQYPQYTAADLPALNPTLADLRASVQAFRPYLQDELRRHHHFEMLAVYVYPAQVLFCKSALSGLADLKGRRVRVSSAAQADFIASLGGVAVYTGFGQIVPSLQAGDSECAITGTMSGNTLGLHRMTHYLHTLPITWGLSFFGANDEAWAAMPPELRALLMRELPRLEDAIWRDAEAETEEGVACNSGAPACVHGEKGSMVVVPLSPEDDARRLRLLSESVLPSWLRRCGDGCAAVWRRTVGRARGIPAPETP